MEHTEIEINWESKLPDSFSSDSIDPNTEHFSLQRYAQYHFHHHDQRCTQWTPSFPGVLLKRMTDVDVSHYLFRRISGYMGDRSTKKQGIESINLLFEKAHSSSEAIDECFLQLCKQLTNHPSKEKTKQGLFLLMVLCGLLHPTEEVAGIVFYTLFQLQRNQHVFGSLVRSSIRRLNQTMQLGNRTHPLSYAEYMALLYDKRIPFRVMLVDEQQFTFRIESHTPAKQLLQQIVDRFEIKKKSSIGLFCIYKDENNKEREIMIPPTLFLSDQLKKYEDREHRFVVKLRCIVEEEENSVSEKGFYLYFIQSMEQYTKEWYTIKEKDHYSLAALALRGYNVPADAPESVIRNFARHIFSPSWLQKNDISFGLIHVQHELTSLAAVNKHIARKTVVKYFRQQPCYGMMMFPALQQSKFSSEENNVLIGISEQKCCLLDPITGYARKEFGVEKILAYGVKENVVALFIGDLSQKWDLYFRSDRAEEIKECMDLYIRKLLVGAQHERKRSSITS